MARPRLSQTKSHVIQVRVDDHQLAILREGARMANLDLSTRLRKLGLDAAKVAGVVGNLINKEAT